jgi:hypothetical protein
MTESYLFSFFDFNYIETGKKFIFYQNSFLFYKVTVSQASLPSHCEKCSLNMKMNVEQWWSDTDRGKVKYFEKNLLYC